MSKSEFRSATLAHILLEEDAVGAATQKFRLKLRNLGSMSVLARDDLAEMTWPPGQTDYGLFLEGTVSCSSIRLQHLQVLVWMCKRQNHRQRTILCIAWRMSRTKMKTQAVKLSCHKSKLILGSSSSVQRSFWHRTLAGSAWRRGLPAIEVFVPLTIRLYIDRSSITSRSLSPTDTHTQRGQEWTRRYKKHRLECTDQILELFWWTETWTRWRSQQDKDKNGHTYTKVHKSDKSSVIA